MLPLIKLQNKERERKGRERRKGNDPTTKLRSWERDGDRDTIWFPFLLLLHEYVNNSSKNMSSDTLGRNKHFEQNRLRSTGLNCDQPRIDSG